MIYYCYNSLSMLYWDLYQAEVILFIYFTL